MESHLSNLPLPLTSFIGREREVQRLKRLLASERLVTLTGPAGCGKTRLALEVASELRPVFLEGTWLADLAPITEPSLVGSAVASSLRIREQPGIPLVATLSEALTSSSALLVLDNCEHLVGSCAELTERLLGECPGLHILATSREQLNIPGETVFPVFPLSTPDPMRRESIEQLEQYESIRLFTARARSAIPDFSVNEQSAESLARICRQLDGIPLALELAAAWVRTLSVEQIAGRLDDRFRLLTTGHRNAPPRQRTLRGALEWSHDLLDEDERRLFNRLSVFAGGFTLDAAEAIGADDPIDAPDVLRILARLVDKSLVATETQPGSHRYRLLETVRLFARARLVTSGESERIHDRHARHYLTVAETAETGLWGPGVASSLDHLAIELENMRAALRWTVGRGEPEIALRLGTALCRFWRVRGYLSEGLRWLDGGLSWRAGAITATRAGALDAAGHLARDRGDYARASNYFKECLALRRQLGDTHGTGLALNSLGTVTQFQGDFEAAAALHQESLSVFRELGDERGIALTLVTLATMAQLREDPETARARYAEGLAAFQRLGDARGIAASLNNLGNLATTCGEYDTAVEYYEESVRLFRDLGDQHEVAASLRNAAGAHRDRGDYPRAIACCQESLTLYRDLGDRRGIAGSLGFLAKRFAEQRDPERATRLLGSVEALRESSGVEVPAFEPDLGQVVARLRDTLGSECFAAAWATGRSSTCSEAIDDALASTAPPSPRDPVASASPLTPRQREVVLLITEGLTNREIAERLFISERTADTHVEHILERLGLRSRAQVGAWAAAHKTSTSPTA